MRNINCKEVLLILASLLMIGMITWFAVGNEEEEKSLRKCCQLLDTRRKEYAG